MNTEKKRTSIRRIQNELTKSCIALERAKQSITEELEIIDNSPVENGPEVNEWGKKFDYALRKADLDTHTLVITVYHLFNYCNRVSEIKKDIPPEYAEMIEIFRHHYEHWEDIEPFYLYDTKRNSVAPPKGSNVAKFFEKYRTQSKESPKGCLHIDYDSSFSPPKRIVIIGGVLNLNTLEDLLQRLQNIVTQLDEKLKQI
jgi:hypothetical protein